MALLNVSPWGDTLNGAPGPQPGVDDYVGQEQGQYDDIFGPGFNGMDFIEAARPRSSRLEVATAPEPSASTSGSSSMTPRTTRRSGRCTTRLDST